jgi:hypothetical protein
MVRSSPAHSRTAQSAARLRVTVRPSVAPPWPRRRPARLSVSAPFGPPPGLPRPLAGRCRVVQAARRVTSPYSAARSPQLAPPPLAPPPLVLSPPRAAPPRPRRPVRAAVPPRPCRAARAAPLPPPARLSTPFGPPPGRRCRVVHSGHRVAGPHSARRPFAPSRGPIACGRRPIVGPPLDRSQPPATVVSQPGPIALVASPPVASPPVASRPAESPPIARRRVAAPGPGTAWVVTVGEAARPPVAASAHAPDPGAGPAGCRLLEAARPPF